MPLYEYICKDCGNRFEVMRRMSERNDAPDCEKCGSEETALALSATAFLGASAGGGGNACSTSAWTGGG
jgi:putative FmdB family regulatory protein